MTDQTPTVPPNEVANLASSDPRSDPVASTSRTSDAAPLREALLDMVSIMPPERYGLLRRTTRDFIDAHTLATNPKEDTTMTEPTTYPHGHGTLAEGEPVAYPHGHTIPTDSRYELLRDDPRFGLATGDILICEPMHPAWAHEKVAVIRRESDGYDPGCSQYRSDVRHLSGPKS